MEGFTLACALIRGGADDVTGGAPPHPLDPVEKDKVTAAMIPDRIAAECALTARRNGTCMSAPVEEAVERSLGVSTIAEVKQRLNCGTERCVLNKMTAVIGPERVKHEIETRLKIRGPTGAELLSNINIDGVMRQWGAAFPEFYPYNFNMVNYADYSYSRGHVLPRPDTLATIPFADLYQTGRHKCAACIINSDTYQREGKHWMALFVDARGQHAAVEFFNSSGQAPAPEFVNWLVKTKADLEALGMSAEIVRASHIKHQRSRSECGLYSLFYVWARLNGVPADYFTSSPVPDQLMFEFRQHLFDDPNGPKLEGDKFDWNDFCKKVKIKWE